MGLKTVATIRSYEDASRFYEEHRVDEFCRGSVFPKIAHNTWLDTSEEPFAYHILFHKTRIVSFHQSGVVVVNSGGYRTRTTKDRINEFSTLVVSQKKGEWWITRKDSVGDWSDWEPFTDNMWWLPDGTFSRARNGASFVTR